MSNKVLNTEAKIFQNALDVFILYGYHGTTIQRISVQAGVRQSVIHYYFRSKENLYVNVVKSLIDNILETNIKLISNKEVIEKYRWFLYTELYNNQNLFETTLQKLYFNEWDDKLSELKKLLEIN
jgi:TetR/AcrR family transcriptional regulator